MKHFQLMGLSRDGEEFLENNVEKTPKCVCSICGDAHGDKVRRSISGHWSDDLWGDIPLFEYRLKGGEVMREVVQEIAYSTRIPCVFLCLRNSVGKRWFEWSREVMDNI